MKTTTTKHVLLFCVDALRFDGYSAAPDRRYLEAAGFAGLLSTPRIDRLKEEGVLFRDAVSVSSYTTASIASMLTGLYPPRSGVRAFLRSPLSPYAATLPERLETAGFTSWSHEGASFLKLFGFERGFARTFDGKDAELFRALEEECPDRLFLYVHFMDVHDPYGHSPQPVEADGNDAFFAMLDELEAELGIDGTKTAAERGLDGPGLVRFTLVRQKLEKTPEGRRKLFELYLKGINRFDRGRLSAFLDHFAKLGILDDALLILLADHGETDYGDSFGHAGPLDEQAIRIPLILRAPGRLPAGRVVDRQASLVDITPTVLDWVGLPAVDDPGFEAPQGRSLLESLEPGRTAENDDRPVYGEVWAEPGTDVLRNVASLQESKKTGAIFRSEGEPQLLERFVRLSPWKMVLHGSEEAVTAIDGGDLSDADFVTALYRTLLGREPDADGHAFHVKLLADGAVSREDMTIAIASSDEAKRRERFFRIDAPVFERDARDTIGVVDDAHPAPEVRDRFMAAIEEIHGGMTPTDTGDVLPASDEEMQRLGRDLMGLGYISISE